MRDTRYGIREGFSVFNRIFCVVLLLSLGLSQTEASSRADTKEDLHQKAKVIYDAIEKLQSESIPEQQEAF
jgi:hypothetical protein